MLTLPHGDNNTVLWPSMNGNRPASQNLAQNNTNALLTQKRLDFIQVP